MKIFFFTLNEVAVIKNEDDPERLDEYPLKPINKCK